MIWRTVGRASARLIGIAIGCGQSSAAARVAARQRCIVPVDGFYEWNKTGVGKHYAIVSADGLPLAMAGLWERWKDRASGGHRPELHHYHNGSRRALRRDS